MTEGEKIFEDFSNFIRETCKEEYNQILTRTYYNFIDKEAEAISFLINKFIEFCEINELKTISKPMLWVFGAFHQSINDEIRRIRTH